MPGADPFLETRDALHCVTVHVVARARVQGTGRFSLRITPTGLGTPEFGADGRRVRIAGTHLVVESDTVGGATATSVSIDGASLTELAALAMVDLAEPLDVGHDTPPPGDIDAPIHVDAGAAQALLAWYRDVSEILDRVLAQLPSGAAATPPRLWPEHFDLAIEADAAPGRRVNLGGSPGDRSSSEPYLYVGPWTDDRPGDATFWNAPFGARRSHSDLLAAGDLVVAGEAFLLEGFGQLAGRTTMPAASSRIGDPAPPGARPG